MRFVITNIVCIYSAVSIRSITITIMTTGSTVYNYILLVVLVLSVLVA